MWDTGLPWAGSDIVNMVPAPDSLWTVISPPWLVIMPCTTDSPRPVPSPTSLVVKERLEDAVERRCRGAGSGIRNREVDNRFNRFLPGGGLALPGHPNAHGNCADHAPD